MADVAFVALVVAFFAVALAYVKGCERIVGPDVSLPTSETGSEVDRPLPDGHVGSGAAGDPVAGLSG